VGDRRVELTHKEFQLLEFLLRHPGEVISRDEFWTGCGAGMST